MSVAQSCAQSGSALRPNQVTLGIIHSSLENLQGQTAQPFWATEVFYYTTYKTSGISKCIELIELYLINQRIKWLICIQKS